MGLIPRERELSAVSASTEGRLLGAGSAQPCFAFTTRFDFVSHDAWEVSGMSASDGATVGAKNIPPGCVNHSDLDLLSKQCMR